MPRCRALDLRFPDAEDESAFKEGVEASCSRFGSIGNAVGCLWATAEFAVHYGVETATSSENSHQPSGRDGTEPRMWHFAMLLYVAAQFAVGCACLVLRGRCGIFKALDVERFVHGVVSVNLLLMSAGSRCSVSLMFGSEPSEVWARGGVEGDLWRSVLALNCALLFLCLLARMRAFLALTLPLSAVGPEVVLRLACGTRLTGPGAADIILCGVSTVLVLLCALAVERSARAEWRAAAKRQETDRQGTKALVSGMEAAAQTLCHIVIGLDSRSRVVRPHPQLTTFFGTAMSGVAFAELLCDDARPCFEAFIRGSSPGMQRCLPATLKHRSSAGTCKAMLLVMCAAGNAPTSYLVGIKMQSTSWSTPRAAGGDDLADIPNMMPVVPSWSYQQTSGSDFDVVWTESVKVGTSEPAFAETGTQADGVFVDPVVTVDRCGNTDITWRDVGFACRACARAQLPPGPELERGIDCTPRQSFSWDAREIIRSPKSSDRTHRKGEAAAPTASTAASSRGQRHSRQKGQETCSDVIQPHTGRISARCSSSGATSRSGVSSSEDAYSSASDAAPEVEGSFDGVWVIRGISNSVSPWLVKLTIQGSTVIDGNDDVLFLDYEDGMTYLAGGLLILEDDVLYRVGRAKKRGVAFVRQPPELK